MKRFSQMNPEELKAEIERLHREWEKAQNHGQESEATILKQKWNLARSYLINPQDIVIYQWYEVEGNAQRFYVKYLNGIMAWGHFENQEREESAVPLACLKHL